MQEYEESIRRMAERLYEDERLRSNLTDDETKIVLGWAQNWISTQVQRADSKAHAQQIAQSESARVYQMVGTLNTLAAKEGALSLSEAVAALESQVKVQQTLPREYFFKLLTEWVTTLWRLQEDPRDSQPGKPIPV